MPIATGKNDRYIEISAFGTSPVMPTAPSATTTIGAIARIGIVCEAMSHGIRLRSSVRTWTMPIASAMPSTAPSAKPSKVEESVIQP